MKIRMTVSVEMTAEQAEAYANEYGLDFKNQSELREDVKSQLANAIQGSYPVEAEFITISDIK